MKDMKHSFPGRALLCGARKLLPQQLRRVVRLTALFFLICYIQVNAGGFAQTVSFSGKDVPLQAVFASFEKQTGFSFFFNYALLKDAKPVTIEVRNVSLEKALKEALKNEALDFYQQGKTIFIVKKQAAAASTDLLAPEAKLTDVKGRVVNQQEEALIGATVAVKNGKKATLTDEKGGFELKAVPVGATLEVTHLGYQRREIEVGGGEMHVEMAVATNKLDEVQVIAYGSTSERLSAGNVTTVKSEEIAKQPVNNPLLALEGRVPGLFITQSSGLPGSGISVRIQGQNSLRRGNDPFYIIDGVPYLPQLLPSINGISGNSGTGFGSQPGNPLSFLNPSDIESIEILKDADATAIYGSQAANGAILITTKKGKAGKTKVDLNLQQGVGNVAHFLKLLNTQQYLQMRREALKNDGIANSSNTDYDLNGSWDTTRYTDWQKTLIGGTAQYTNLSAGVSGGSTSAQYLAGATFRRETTVFPGDFADLKGSFHFNLNSTSSNQKFRFQLTSNYLIDNNRLTSNDLANFSTVLSPIAPAIYNTDGSLNWQPNTTGTSTWANPFSYLYNTYQGKTTNLISNVILSYQILPGLEVRGNFGYTNLQTNEAKIFPLLSTKPELRASASRYTLFGNNNLNSWIVEPQLEYKRIIGNGKLDVLVGTTIRQLNSQGLQIYGLGYASDYVMKDLSQASSIVFNSSINSVYKYNAAFGRINYTLQDKYIIDLTARRDGSSRFGNKNQFHNFGAVGAAWVFSKEQAFSRLFKFISFGKLRGSYGTTGNDEIGDYQFLNLYNPTSASVAYQNAVGLAPNGLPNPYLAWEQTRKLQVGMELGILKDRVIADVCYLNNRSSNQLLQYALPIITGNTGINENFSAVIQNSEWEISLATENMKSKSFKWSSIITLTLPENKLISFPNLFTSSLATQLVIGQPITIVKTFHFLGVDPNTGVYQFADLHGNPTSSPNPITDQTVVINTYPKVYGGVQNTFRYKGFEIAFFAQFVKQLGGSYTFGNLPGYFDNTRGNGNQPTSVLRRWQKPGDITFMQKYNSNLSLGAQVTNAKLSDASYADATYIRLKNVSVSWDLPASWTQKVHIQNCQLYVHGQNLLTITNYDGLDPETKSATILPPLRVIVFGMQLTL